MIDAYVTAADADVILAGYTDWIALAEAVKEDHLSWGRVWIDSKYTCLTEGVAYDETTATDELKHANTLVGYVNSTGVLFASPPSVKSTSVGAGPVATSKTYAAGYTADSAEAALMSQAKLLLGYDCTADGGNASKGLTRN